jgi:hypothetical protein
MTSLIMNRLLAFSVFALAATAVQADSVSYTGTLTSSTDVFETTFTLSSPTTIGLQTWGFGGTGWGKNAAGNPVSAWRHGSFPWLLVGTGASATILTTVRVTLRDFGGSIERR